MHMCLHMGTGAVELNKSWDKESAAVKLRYHQPSFCCRTKAAEDQPVHRVEVKSVRASGKGAIFSLPSHSLSCVS